MKAKTINGWTKQGMIDTIKKEFKGKAQANGRCLYLTEDGKKCAVGCFIPDGHPAQKRHTLGAVDVSHKYPDLVLPLNPDELIEFQREHDLMDTYLSQNDQLAILINWIERNVED